jgi:hypothetical protein
LFCGPDQDHNRPPKAAALLKAEHVGLWQVCQIVEAEKVKEPLARAVSHIRPTTARAFQFHKSQTQQLP